MSNREKRTEIESLHLYLALARPSQGEKADCLRTIIKGHYNELEILKSKLQTIGGYWRIYKTVNARDVQKARIWLMKDLLDHPEHASYIDSQWRTALLQPECNIDKNFMLDVDTSDINKVTEIKYVIRNSGGEILKEIKSPKGWHFITKPFDTRRVCSMPDVTLIRDGYYFICEVGNV
jgi:hypothetical protein